MVSSGDDVNDLERVSLTHETISTSAVVPLSGMREEALHCVSSDLQAWWRLTRGCYQLSHNAGDFLLRGDAQRNSTHNLGPSSGNFASPCTCENWHQPSRLACLLSFRHEVIGCALVPLLNRCPVQGQTGTCQTSWNALGHNCFCFQISDELCRI